MIRYADERDFDILKEYDIHISKKELLNCLKDKRILLILDNETFIGWLRFNFFWDNTPFMNMLFILEKYRNNGFGRELVNF